MRYFHFKQFRIGFDKDVMPLTADAVLFGAWINSSGRKRILDVGCGTGILTLIQAQRNPTSEIIALDISEKAIQICHENVQCSPFSNKIKVVRNDFFSLDNFGQFDLIIVNPPFFSSGIASSNPFIANSRHNYQFNLEVFMSKAWELTTTDGILSLLSTVENREECERLAMKTNWNLNRRTKTGVRPESTKRVFLEWSKGLINDVKEQFLKLPSNEAPGNKTYYDLVSDLYL